MRQPDALRRLIVASLALPALPLLQGCAAPLPPMTDQATAPAAHALLAASAQAHGLQALAAIDDVSVGYAGTFHGVVDRLQPELVDAGFRGRAQDRLLLQKGVVAQAQAGPKGTKQVVREAGAGTQGGVRAWFNGTEALDRRRRDAAALVADCYSLFLLGPMLLAGQWAADRTLAMALTGAERVTVDGRDHDCDVLRIHMQPGLGMSDADELALYIDRSERLMRRLRFTLNGFQPTRGAVAEVDAWGHLPLHEVLWASQYEERLLRPLPLPVHEWHMTGLDVNRRLDRGAISGPAFSGAAWVAAGRRPGGLTSPGCPCPGPNRPLPSGHHDGAQGRVWMHRRALLRAIGGLAPLLALEACARTAPLHDVQDAAFVGVARLPQRAEQIKRAGTSLGWIMQEQRPGLMRGTLNLRTHQAVVDVPYDTRRFSIRYVSSTDLNYSGPVSSQDRGGAKIHRNYNGWIENLEHKISAESSS